MKIVFATNNINKLNEVQTMLPSEIQLISLQQIGCFDEIPETGSTIEANAILKAQYVKKNYGFDVFADDTGLEIRALNNEPGVYSARYAGEHKNNQDNINLVLKKLEGVLDRRARFKTIISLCIDNQVCTFEGIVEGNITSISIGENGFGYDAIFQPLMHQKTFAQMTPEEKNSISHRKIAMQKLVAFLQEKIKK